MRAKFNIEDTVPVRFVTESDGSTVDSEDLAEIAGCNETLMVLSGSDQQWSKVRNLNLYLITLKLLGSPVSE